MLRKRIYSPPRAMAEINVTPLVDVMLVLLIIFMITAPMFKAGIDVDLPQAETAQAPAEHRLIITIDKKGYIYFGKKIIHQALLEEQLKAYFHGASKKVVFLQADKSVPYGKVIKVLDIIKKSGIETVGMVVQPKR
ncbi:MAG: protein TolR [Candidatus Aminicenantes bacterium]|nr:protein TolR [Candidatus Aminicenantes bacterium]